MKSVIIQKRQLFKVYYLIYCLILVIIFILLSPTPCLSTSSNAASSGNSRSEQETKENFFWRLYSRGKSYFFGRGDHFNTNSSRRTGHYNSARYEDDPPEHRIVNGPFDINDEEPERKEISNGGSDTGSGWGWSWSQPQSHGTDHHMQLYTLLGGLSFASFLATAVLLLTRRNGTVFRSSSPENYLLNLIGNRKEGHVYQNSVKEQLQESHDKFDTVPEFVYKLGKIFSPWWYVLQRDAKEEDTDMEIYFVPVNVTRVPSSKENDKN